MPPAALLEIFSKLPPRQKPMRVRRRHRRPSAPPRRPGLAPGPARQGRLPIVDTGLMRIVADTSATLAAIEEEAGNAAVSPIQL